MGKMRHEEELDPNSMDCPCPCESCGAWFELEDGMTSARRGNGQVICEACGMLEEDEYEINEEIDDVKNTISDAEYTLKESKQDLIRLEVLLKEKVEEINKRKGL